VEPLDDLMPRVATYFPTQERSVCSASPTLHSMAAMRKQGGDWQCEDNEAQLCWSRDLWDGYEDLAVEGFAEWESDVHRLRSVYPIEDDIDLPKQVADKQKNGDAVRCESISSLSTATSQENTSRSVFWPWGSAFSFSSSMVSLASPSEQNTLVDATDRECECNNDWEFEFMWRVLIDTGEADEADHAIGSSL